MKRRIAISLTVQGHQQLHDARAKVLVDLAPGLKADRI
jgi:hypothetical protein